MTSNNSGSSASAVPDTLTAPQLHALFDILTHYGTYSEVECFKNASAISTYGYPFASSIEGASKPVIKKESSVPLLATVLRAIVLPVPGVRDLPAGFWPLKFQGILTKFGEADLSESYDKGSLGSRKTLATGASVIHESVSRGLIGGLPKGSPRDLNGKYDRAMAQDLVRAWEDVLHELVYGNLVGELFDRIAEKPDIEGHSLGVQTAVDYIIIHLATFMHHVFVLSPEGSYLLQMVASIHKLVPYSAVKQTLRIGNAASMISGLVRLVLAKMSVGGLTNWLGLTQNADDGMNLLQRIISLILSWDMAEFRKTAERIERAKGGPSKDHMAVIKEYVAKSREDHLTIRNTSVKRSESIISTIFNESRRGLMKSLSKEQHEQCLEYLSTLLAIRDRDEIIKILCKQNPDLFTQAVRDFIGSFEPMIRAVHQNIDLREHVSAAESFLTDLIETSKAKDSPVTISSTLTADKTLETRAPSIEDYVGLIRRHRQSAYNFVHQVAKNCPEIKEDFLEYCKKTLAQFRQKQPEKQPSTSATPSNNSNSQTIETTRLRKGAAGSLSTDIQALFTALPPSIKPQILAAADAHATYLSSLEDLSLKRMQHILDDLDVTNPPPPPSLTAEPKKETKFSLSTTSPFASRNPSRRNSDNTKNKKASMCGPGMFLSRWQSLMDETLITPQVPTGGQVRRGRDVKGVIAQAKTTGEVASDADKAWDSAALMRLVETEVPSPPDVQVVVKMMGSGFGEVVEGRMLEKIEIPADVDA
ncbi:PX-associated-domain-containing protein [Sordaria sp. MPI-SDFR-AT-0083]|nr:PX-associated-domain-containing protein [Sordaria sp. MPI-SDFR-AT-0083]